MSEDNKDLKKSNSSYTKGQRILALVGALVLAGMVVATLICAICHAPGNVIFALLFCDIIIPILLWVFIRVTAHYKKTGEEMAERSKAAGSPDKSVTEQEETK